MTTFNAVRPYDADLDVRDWSELAREIDRTERPHGVLWPLIGARRTGKTWALKALHGLLRDATYLDAPTSDALEKLEPARHRVCLIDEPGRCMGQDPGVFLDACARLVARRVRLVVAMAPGEWSALRVADEHGHRCSPKDRRFFVEPLTRDQATRLARTDHAKTLLEQLRKDAPAWCRSAFLLELVLQVHEEAPDLDLHDVLLAAIRRAAATNIQYTHFVLDRGLSPAQRHLVELVAQGDSASEDVDVDLLVRCGLLSRSGRRLQLADPVIDAALRPLVIHHVSDIHFGGKAQHIGDVKPRGAHRARFGDAVGAGPAHELYARHVEELARDRKAPHLLVISGDIAEKGQPEEYEQAQAWLDSIRPQLAAHPLLGPDQPRVLLVGGNHDVDWNQALGVEGSRDRHRPFAAAFEDYARPRLEDSPETRTTTRVPFPGLDIELVLLGSGEYGGDPPDDAAGSALLALVDKLRGDAATEKDESQAALLRQWVGRIDPGLVHDQDLRRIPAADAPGVMPVRIAVLHHPVSPMPGRAVQRFAGLVNAGDVKDTLLRKRFALVLHGHTHAGWLAEETWPHKHPDWILRVASAPSLGSSEKLERNGFNVVRLLRNPGEGAEPLRLEVTRQVLDGTDWKSEASLGPVAPGS